MRRLASVIAICLPSTALAVGGLDETPPTETQTTTECAAGQVWDAAEGACVAPKESNLDDDTLYRAVREFAYTGDYDAALGTLAAMSDQEDDRVLTYLGFVNRKLGRTDMAMDHYRRALAQNPDNLLARSYYGQALVLGGNMAGAEAQLTEIRARGGRGSWPEVSLRLALNGGTVSSY